MSLSSQMGLLNPYTVAELKTQVRILPEVLTKPKENIMIIEKINSPKSLSFLVFDNLDVGEWFIDNSTNDLLYIKVSDRYASWWNKAGVYGQSTYDWYGNTTREIKRVGIKLQYWLNP